MQLKDIPILGTKFWKKIGGQIPGWIKSDLDRGIFQYGIDKQPYRSRQYVRYKANRMERFTNKTGAKGTKIKSFRGQAAYSTETRFVNMQLSGATIRGLKGKNATKTGITMSYPLDSTKKILGNERYGRGIVGLNDKNIRLVKSAISKELGIRVKRLPKKRIIYIG